MKKFYILCLIWLLVAGSAMMAGATPLYIDSVSYISFNTWLWIMAGLIVLFALMVRRKHV